MEQDDELSRTLAALTRKRQDAALQSPSPGERLAEGYRRERTASDALRQADVVGLVKAIDQESRGAGFGLHVMPIEMPQGGVNFSGVFRYRIGLTRKQPGFAGADVPLATLHVTPREEGGVNFSIDETVAGGQSPGAGTTAIDLAEADCDPDAIEHALRSTVLALLRSASPG